VDGTDGGMLWDDSVVLGVSVWKKTTFETTIEMETVTLIGKGR